MCLRCLEDCMAFLFMVESGAGHPRICRLHLSFQIYWRKAPDSWYKCPLHPVAVVTHATTCSSLLVYLCLISSLIFDQYSKGMSILLLVLPTSWSRSNALRCVCFCFVQCSIRATFFVLVCCSFDNNSDQCVFGFSLSHNNHSALRTCSYSGVSRVPRAAACSALTSPPQTYASLGSDTFSEPRERVPEGSPRVPAVFLPPDC